MTSEYVAYNASRYPTDFSIPLHAGSAMKHAKFEIYKKAQDDWELEAELSVEKEDFYSFQSGKIPSVHDISLEPNEEIMVITSFAGEKEVSDSHLMSNGINSLKYELSVKYRQDQFKLGARISSAFDFESCLQEDEEGWTTHKVHQDTPLLKGASAYIYWQPIAS